MNTTKPEQPVVPKTGYTSTSQRDSVLEESYVSSPDRKVSGKTLNKKSLPRATVAKRFNRAFGKSLSVRMRNLGRRLTLTEFKRLILAVRKQITRRIISPLETVLSELSQRISRLENACPSGALELQDSIGMYAAQVAVLREQNLQAISEREELSETCSHFSKRRKWIPRGPIPTVEKVIPGLGRLVVTQFPSELTLACEKCTEKRDEALFYWTGMSLPLFSDIISPGFEKEFKQSGAQKVPPLSVQQVWSSLLDLKYTRSINTPAF